MNEYNVVIMQGDTPYHIHTKAETETYAIENVKNFIKINNYFLRDGAGELAARECKLINTEVL